MWQYDKQYNFWSITKTSGFITLTFDLWKPGLLEHNTYRLCVKSINDLHKDFKAKDFEDAKLQANELIYDALRWNR